MFYFEARYPLVARTSLKTCSSLTRGRFRSPSGHRVPALSVLDFFRDLTFSFFNLYSSLCFSLNIFDASLQDDSVQMIPNRCKMNKDFIMFSNIVDTFPYETVKWITFAFIFILWV